MATTKLKSVALSKVEVNEFSTATITLATEAELTAGLATKADKATTLAGYGITDAMTSTEIQGAINQAVAGAFKFKGVATAVDGAKITTATGDVTASADNNGHVYQIGDKEYASNGETWVELGFGFDASALATKQEVTEGLAKKVDIVEGQRLMLETEGTKLAGIAEGAQVNVIDSVDTAELSIDDSKKLGIVAVSMDKVTGLATALDGKVAKVDGYQLMSAEESAKLAGIAAGAQVNVIDAVSAEFSIGEGKTLALAAVEMAKVTGLADALALKANDADVIKQIKLNGSAVAVTGGSVDLGSIATSDELKGVSDRVTALETAPAKALKVEGAVTALSSDYSIDEIAQVVSALVTKINAMNA